MIAPAPPTGEPWGEVPRRLVQADGDLATSLERMMRRGSWLVALALATFSTAWAARPTLGLRPGDVLRSRPPARAMRTSARAIRPRSAVAQPDAAAVERLGGADVSVIIPAYKAAGTIARAIESVLAQTVPVGEVIVVDDGSPDDLAGAVAPFAGRIIYMRKPNGGASSARNLGIARARGALLAFLDADDHWEPDKIARQLQALADHPEVGLVGARLYLAEPGDDGRAVDPATDVALADRVLHLDAGEAFHAAANFWTGTVMIRRDVLGDDRFDEALTTAEDRDLWMRLLLRTPAYLIRDPLATCVLVPGSLSRSSVERDCRNLLAVVDRYRPELGEDAYHRWVAEVHRKWSAGLLGQGDARGALAPAVERLRLDPSAEALWIVAKSAALATRGRPAAAAAPAPRGLTVEEVGDLAGFCALAREWDQLHVRTGGAIVGAWAWLYSWWEVFGDGRELAILVARDRDGRLVGVAPLQRRRVRELGVPLRRIELLATGEDEADEILSEYLDFVIEPGREAEVVAGFWQHLADAGDWDDLYLRAVPAASPVVAALQAATASAWVTVDVRPRADAVIVPLAATSDAFLAAQAKKMREDLRRHRRQLEKTGTVVLRRAATVDELRAMFPVFVDLHQRLWASRGEPGCFASAKFTRFHELVSERLFARGLVDLYLLEVGGRPVAARYAFHVGARYFEYQSGLDPEFEPKISTGVQCALYCIEDVIRRGGFAEYDLGEGPRPYKLRWSHVRRQNLDVRIARWTVAATTRAVLADGEQRLRTLRRGWPARRG